VAAAKADPEHWCGAPGLCNLNTHKKSYFQVTRSGEEWSLTYRSPVKTTAFTFRSVEVEAEALNHSGWKFLLSR
jgi:hypothetical protein